MKTHNSNRLRLISIPGNLLPLRGFTPLKGLLALALVFGALVLAPACPAYACSCIPAAAPLDALAEATAVFEGEVLGIATPDPVEGVFSSADTVEVTFHVEQVWKGEVAGVTSLFTAASSASCGFEFQTGQSYIVYARSADGQLQASLCSRTRLIEQAGEDMEALGKGAAPAPYPPPGSEPPPPGATPEAAGLSRTQLIGIGGVAAVVVGSGLLLAVWLIRPKK